MLNEVCIQMLEADESYFVEISPGGPSDFGAGAQLIGTSGEEVSDVGDEALWFGGSDADDGGVYGVIVVREETQHGTLYFRVLIGRPDVDEATQRQLAIQLANTALPRFPGVEVELPPETEAELVTFDEGQPPDTSNLSLVDNLLAKEERGEWTRGGGLVASLGLVAGEVDQSAVHAHSELFDQSATPVILLAREYVETGDNPVARSELERLLDDLTLSREELDLLTDAPSASGLLVSAIPVAQENDDPCVVDPVENCLSLVPLSQRFGVPPDKYHLYADLSQNSAWTEDDLEVAKQTILDAAQKYEALGTIPATTVFLQAGGDELYTDADRDDCEVYIYDGLAGADPDDNEFRQVIAREMAFCLILGEFYDLILADTENTLWWSRGLADYLSGYVVPSANVEHRKLPETLAEIELSTTFDERSRTNWIFFEYLHPIHGAEGNLALISGFPQGGDHIAALAAYSEIPELFHDFEQALTDANVPDQGSGTVPFQPRAWELSIIAPVETTLTLPPFGVRRIHITVPDDLYACFETFETGEAKSSWRPGVPGEAGSWEDGPPVALQAETMLVVTAVKPGAEFVLDVAKVSDDPDCNQEEEQSPPTTLGDCGICGPSRYYHP